MKRTKTILCLLLCLILTGCGYAVSRDYYQDVAGYADVWELAGIREGVASGKSLFPSEIQGLAVEKFFCRYDQQLPLGEGFQILLTVRYDEEAFGAEAARLESMARDCSDRFDSTEYRFLELHFAESDLGLYEYAAIDEEDRTIRYVYLLALPREEIELDSTLLPRDYQGI